MARPAHAGDTAPIGSLLIAIGAGKACLIRILQADTQTGYFGGRLPDGTCLAL
ncbi:hypothetical protein [Winogradskya humida]|uniref:Uncharacterized protein n=1 Tax=Winogradskya humida TaxID=113566 RepID=A0ABQ4A3L1_9ACTN|nr:hypothetical protein [Actinoplanes humidus]GIE24937.1 hypothetical protein Ahu01nite_080390 [Actinoplanes humidus]